MWFWWYMLACDLLIPVILMAAGRMMWKHCPKRINWALGYRTALSMKNADTWRFAHDHCGRLWWKLGAILVIPSVLILIPFRHSGEKIIGIVGLALCAAQLAVLLASVFSTEAALRKAFHPDGTRK